jgi:hypothetical protein
VLNYVRFREIAWPLQYYSFSYSKFKQCWRLISASTLCVLSEFEIIYLIFNSETVFFLHMGSQCILTKKGICASDISTINSILVWGRPAQRPTPRHLMVEVDLVVSDAKTKFLNVGGRP